MSLQITIPDSILQSIRFPEPQIEQELLKELAVALYCKELLPFSKAQELAQMDSRHFSQLIEQRDISRRCSKVEVNGELVYVCSE